MFSPDVVLIKFNAGRLTAEILRWCGILGLGVCIGRIVPDQLTRFMACVAAVVLLKIAADFLFNSITPRASVRQKPKNLYLDLFLGILLALSAWLVLMPIRNVKGPYPLGLDGALFPLILSGGLTLLASYSNALLISRPCLEKTEDPGFFMRYLAERDPSSLAAPLIALEGMLWLAIGIPLAVKSTSAAGALYGFSAGTLVRLTLEVLLLLQLGKAGPTATLKPEPHEFQGPNAALIVAVSYTHLTLPTN